MNILSAVISGIVASLVFSIVLTMAPRMRLPKMDIVDLLGSMFSGKSNPVLGWMMHLMMGMVFALIYAFLWSRGIGAATWTGGLVFGAVHWPIVGVIMAMIPMMHAGIKSGAVPAPGMWMMNNGGLMAFIGGLVGHMIFGVVVALIYTVL
ncbi:MAG TPA: hypothetical protein PLX14_01270 [Anaerolineales bacterium]|nr:hypothetical protein [Anaerolineales bacterium]